MLALASTSISYAAPPSAVAGRASTVAMSSGFRGPQREGWTEQVRNAGLKNTRDTFGRKKAGANDVNSLKGYKVGSRAPSASINSGTRARGYSIEFDPTLSIGVQEPTGFFDPAGFTDGIDETTFQTYRVAELKHGRVAMLACLGYIVPYITKLPGSLTLDGATSFADVPNGLQALQALPPLGIAQIFLLAGLLETGPFKEKTTNDGTFISPGDYGFDPLDLLIKSAAADDELTGSEVLARKQSIELANGRLAMMGAAGFIVGDLLNGGNPYIGSPFEVGSFTL